MNHTRSYLILVIALAIIVATYHWGARTRIYNLDSAGTNIIAFGDSLVRGVGSTPGNDLFSQLSERIGQPILNMGVSGDTTADAIARLDAVLAADPRLVIIVLGGNDYLKRVPMDITFENLDQIVDTIQTRGAAVLILGVRGGLIRDTYDDRFRAFAHEHHAGFVSNILDNLIGDTKYMYDTIHPNDLGYAKIADRVEPVLRKMLDRR
ncbi:MAG: arylesterase [Candidatus Pacebacteria bacterium]|nr:arylesterase [Candidatus Paceibacterota bacterium]